MYTLLTTYPPKGCRNVGDKLIEEAIKELIIHEKGETEFLTFFREDDLTEHLEEINKTKAILLPLAIRDTPLWPKTFRLIDDLSKIKVPMIPINTCYNVYPGDELTREGINYSKETKEFLHYIAQQVEQFSCREYYTNSILQKIGIKNTVMTGDPSWYQIDKLGTPMRRPENISKLVFSPPLSHFYTNQAKDVMELLSEMFPDAEKYCAFHTADLNTLKNAEAENSFAMSEEATQKNVKIAQYAKDYGFEEKYVFGELDNLEFYHDCDLHVGYECHAHLYFLRQRSPSILINEDARGVGFQYSLGGNSFNSFERCAGNADYIPSKTITSGYCTSLREYSIAPENLHLIDQLRQFLEEELENKFRRITGIAQVIDDTYFSSMKPFLESLP